MTEETAKFKVYCVEAYRRAHGTDARTTIALFNRYSVFDYLNIESLQWQSLDATVSEIDEYIECRSGNEF